MRGSAPEERVSRRTLVEIGFRLRMGATQSTATRGLRQSAVVLFLFYPRRRRRTLGRTVGQRVSYLLSDTYGREEDWRRTCSIADDPKCGYFRTKRPKSHEIQFTTNDGRVQHGGTHRCPGDCNDYDGDIGPHCDYPVPPISFDQHGSEFVQHSPGLP